MENKYLQLEFSTGRFFEASKEAKDGYVEFVSTKGNTSFRKYHSDGVTGKVGTVELKDSKIGSQVTISLIDGDVRNILQVGLSDQRGNVDTYAESFIKLLPSIEKDSLITFRAYNFVPEGEFYKKIGISISSKGVKLKGLTNAYLNKDGVLVEGDIPHLVWKKDALGKNKPTAVSLEAKNDKLLEVLKEQVERLKYNPSNQNESAPQQAAQPKEKEKPFLTEESNNDLPF